MAGFVTYMEKMTGAKVREKSEKFFDHFSQARLFYESQTEIERDHIVSAFRFELGKVQVPEIRERMVTILNQILPELADRVAAGLGIDGALEPLKPLNQSVPADANILDFQPRDGKKELKPSPQLSIVHSGLEKASIRTRKIAFLAADGCDDNDLNTTIKTLTDQGALAAVIAPRLGYLQTNDGNLVKIHHSFLTASSVLFDAIYVPGGEQSISMLQRDPAVLEFVFEAYKHAKAIAASGEGVQLLRTAGVLNESRPKDEAIVTSDNGASEQMISKFIDAVAKHRNWQREKMLRVDLQTPAATRKSA